MKVTKFGQSCLLIEGSSGRILIDPGNLAVPRHSGSEFGKLDAAFYTHLHGDHLDQSFAKELSESGVPIYANADAIEQKLQGFNAQEIQSGTSFSVAGFKIEAFDLPHFAVEGVEMPANTGFVIDGVLFHPGDSVAKSAAQASTVALTIGGPYDDFFQQAESLANNAGAKKIIPIHYEGRYKPNPKEFASVYRGSAEILILEDGQSTDL